MWIVGSSNLDRLRNDREVEKKQQQFYLPQIAGVCPVFLSALLIISWFLVGLHFDYTASKLPLAKWAETSI